MTKKDIIGKVARGESMRVADAERIVNAVFGYIADGLSSGQDVKIDTFGVFKAKTRAARTARNPATGGTVEVPAKNVVQFKPAPVLKNYIN